MSDQLIITTGQVVIALIGAAVPGIFAIIQLSLLRRKVTDDVKAVHTELNSRLSQWKEETKQAAIAAVIAAKAEGVKEQKEAGAEKLAVKTGAVMEAAGAAAVALKNEGRAEGRTEAVKQKKEKGKQDAQ